MNDCPRRRNISLAPLVLVLATLAAWLAPARASALELLCDSSAVNCRTQLTNMINAETVGIDVGMWFMEDARYVNLLVNKMNAGVKVRILMDPRANDGHPANETNLNTLKNAGVPMRKRITSGIEHWKAMIFAGQNSVYFGSANFSDDAFVPVTPYENYVDETIYFTDDPLVVNSFKRKFEDAWTDTSSYTNYSNGTDLTRRYPLYSINPELNFPPGQDFANRSVTRYNAENQKIDVIMYRITDQRHTNAMINARARGVPMRMIVDPTEYRNPDRQWDSWNVDRMYAAGIPMKITVHDGINHGKLTLLYGQGMTIFGSSNWTSPSANSQHEHNYFTTKTYIFNWFVDWFNRKWNNTAPNGAVETADFVPLPPDKPQNISIADGAVGVSVSNQKLVWHGGLWAHIYDVYFGTTPDPPLFAAGQNLGPSESANDHQSFVLPTLQGGTTYYWKIVSKTMAQQSKTGSIWSFTTAGSPPPPPPGATTVVLWTSSIPAASVHGDWVRIADSSAAGGAALQNPDRGRSKVAPALASPANYFEASFSALGNVPYHVWIRMRAQNNSTSNDSVHAQFNDSVDSLGTPTMRIGTTSSAEFVLQNGPDGAAGHGWGWTENGWESFGPNILFAADGSHTIRIQQREDGAIIDQIVISPDTYVSASPGARQDDTTILPQTGGSGPPPPPPGPSADTIVLWTANAAAADVHGNWQQLTDNTAAGGEALWNPDAGATKVAPALANPPNYFEMAFTADAGKAYHVWVRMRAQNNSLSNDSVHLQFNDSVNSGGGAIARIGTSGSLEYVLQDGSGGPPDHGWGWTENGWGSLGPHVYFAASGTHTVRVQQREDGPIIDQIVISPDTYLTASPGTRQDDTTILDASAGGPAPPPPESGNTVVLWTADAVAANVHGSWQLAADTTAAGDSALWNPDAGASKVAPALANPPNYFEMSFDADTGTAYHVWIRMRAQNDSTSNDSVHMQFSDSVNSSGSAIARIGTSASLEFVLQDGPTGVHGHGWGWTENGWGSLGPNIFFAATGTHTLRVQQREDGPRIDQIVISPDTYLSSSPGRRTDDATILPASDGTGTSTSTNTLVLWMNNAAPGDINGNWTRMAIASAAGGEALHNVDMGAAKIAPAESSPANFVDLTFPADANRAYHVWIRMRAEDDSTSNDSVHMQFSDTVNASNTAIARIGTTQSLEFVLQDGPSGGAHPHGWGWTENGWGSLGAHVYFEDEGTHTLRVQQREDGAIVDQIVLSPDKYLTASPGARTNDATILDATNGSGT